MLPSLSRWCLLRIRRKKVLRTRFSRSLCAMLRKMRFVICCCCFGNSNCCCCCWRCCFCCSSNSCCCGCCFCWCCGTNLNLWKGERRGHKKNYDVIYHDSAYDLGVIFRILKFVSGFQASSSSDAWSRPWCPLGIRSASPARCATRSWRISGSLKIKVITPQTIKQIEKLTSESQ